MVLTTRFSKLTDVYLSPQDVHLSGQDIEFLRLIWFFPAGKGKGRREEGERKLGGMNTEKMRRLKTERCNQNAMPS